MFSIYLISSMHKIYTHILFVFNYILKYLHLVYQLNLYIFINIYVFLIFFFSVLVSFKNRMCSCGLFFSSQVTLSRHKMWHHRESSQLYRYNCIHCPYSTNESSHFKAHSCVHDPKRPFHCSFCGNRFKNVTTLKSHVLIHTGENPMLFSK